MSAPTIPAPAPERGNPTAALAILLSLPVVGVAVSAVVLSIGLPPLQVQVALLALVTTLVALIPFSINAALPPTRRHFLPVIFCMLFVLVFVMPVAVYYLPIGGVAPVPLLSNSILPRDLIVGQWISLGALAFFLAAYFFTPARLIQRVMRKSDRDWKPMVSLGVACVMLLLGWAISIVGLTGVLPVGRASGIYSTFSSMVIYGNVLLAMLVFRYRYRIAAVLLGIAVSMSSLLLFFTGSKRKTLIFPAIVAITWMLMRGRIGMRWLVAGAAALMLLYPVAQFYRSDILENNTLTIVDAAKHPARTLGRLSGFLTGNRGADYMQAGLQKTVIRLDGIGVASVIIRDTPTVSPFQNGRTLVLFFYSFVPRLFWPGKPSITIGQWITDTYGPGPQIHSNTGPTFIGDLYLNFGLWGVLLGMAFFGFVLRLFQAYFLGARPTAPGLLAAAIVVSGIITRIEGTLAQTLSTAFFAFIPLWLVHLALVQVGGTVRISSETQTSEALDATPSVVAAR